MKTDTNNVFLPVSAVIITQQHADKLDKTLAALRPIISDIVVIDAMSTDHTEQVCTKHGARHFRRTWQGYTNQKNFGNDQAKHPWILSLDDDEVISDELAAAIQQTFIADEPPPFEAFDLAFHTYFCGKRIRFGAWNPERHVRLFSKKNIQWNTDAVHEGLTITPDHRIGKLAGVVCHYTVDSATQFAEKTERYATLFAERASLQSKKANFLKRFLNPIWRFVAEYVFKLGFLDGYYGLFIAYQNARYTYLKYKYLSERTRNSNSNFRYKK